MAFQGKKAKGGSVLTRTQPSHTMIAQVTHVEPSMVNAF